MSTSRLVIVTGGSRGIGAAVARPVNVLMDPDTPPWTLEALQAAGVRRVNLGRALARTAEDAWTEAARTAIAEGRFAYRRAVAEAFADAR